MTPSDSEFNARERSAQPSNPEPMSGPEEQGAPRGARQEVLAWTWGLLVVASIVYAGLMASKIGRAYVDFGDGNYLYISSRIADGLAPYRDIMAPQPPMHLLIGSWLLRTGAMMGGELHAVRWFSILLHIAIAFLAASITRFLTRSRFGGALAGAVYLFIPNGVLWSLGYQSEPLEIFFLAAMVRLILPLRTGALIGASIFGALAIFTNMTALPYVFVACAWLIFRKRWQSAAFVAPLAALVILGVAILEIWTGAYLQNVFFNQVGTYPKAHLFSYVVRKISTAFLEISYMEGAVTGVALAGLAAYGWAARARRGKFWNPFSIALVASVAGSAAFLGIVRVLYGMEISAFSPETKEMHVAILRQARPFLTLAVAAGALMVAGLVLGALKEPDLKYEFLCLFGMCSLGSIVFVSKGGTMQYIFTIGEPYVAVFFAAAIVTLARKGIDLSAAAPLPIRLLKAAGAAVAIAAALSGFAYQSYKTLDRELLRDGTYEASEERVDQIARLIKDRSEPRDAILSPPYYAYISRRYVAGEYSEIFIWTIGYLGEQGLLDPGSAEPYRKPREIDGPFTRKVLELESLLNGKAIPLVILDMAQTGKLYPIRAALAANYRPLLAEGVNTRNTPLGFYVPLNAGDSPAPSAQTLDDLYPPRPEEIGGGLPEPAE